MSEADQALVADFSALTPDTVLNAVEEVLGERCSNLCRPLNSYINRVYEIGLASGETVIAKFYRPGRWSRDALQDELDFLQELAAAEVPVVPPIAGRGGTVLHALGPIWFTLFPKKGGRALDEPDAAIWSQLGRLIGRMHQVGAQRMPRDRIYMDPLDSTTDQVEYILDSGLVSPEHEAQYEDICFDLIDLTAPLFEDVPILRIHADCHAGNILYRPGEGFHLLDFDDLSVGPAVQDLWLILPDRLPQARRELDWLLNGYQLFYDFPMETLTLIEPLRAMRFIHYTAWCVRQKADGGFSRLAPDWGSSAFWQQEIIDLDRQRAEITSPRF